MDEISANTKRFTIQIEVSEASDKFGYKVSGISVGKLEIGAGIPLKEFWACVGVTPDEAAIAALRLIVETRRIADLT